MTFNTTDYNTIAYAIARALSEDFTTEDADLVASLKAVEDKVSEALTA